MDFLLIGDSKLKITVTSDEIQMYGLSELIGGTNNHATRRNFWKILNKAEAEVGFTPSRDKLLVQLYRTSGGCEIFVTKLGLLSQSSARLVERSDKVTLISRRILAYRFDCPRDLINAARVVKRRLGGEKSQSDAYVSEDGACFLLIEEYEKGDEDSEFLELSEFGNRLTADAIPYIREHMTEIGNKNAVELLASIPP